MKYTYISASRRLVASNARSQMASSCWRCPRWHRVAGLDDRAGLPWRVYGVEKVAAVMEMTESGGGGSCAEVGGWVGEDVRVMRIALPVSVYLVHISYYSSKTYRLNLQVSTASSYWPRAQDRARSWY
jgi:hypothetical protein